MSQTLNAAIAVVGIDIGKNSFHIVGHDERGAIILRQKWSRGQVEARFANMSPCLIGMEACVGAHHLSRKLRALGHDARMMPAKYVRPYSKGQKNDFRDAEAIAEAVQRPTMKFVATKPPSPPQQAEVTLPQVEPKEVEKPKPVPQPPAPETRAPPKNDRLGQFSEAGSNAYNALVFGHLQRFKRYPAAARGKSGTVVVRFMLNRAGDVIESAVTKSSGNDVLDREAVAILQRASPFPAFPAAKSGSQELTSHL